MADRSGDWFRQAERDLEMAQEARRLGHHDWACFASHQAAEKGRSLDNYYIPTRYPNGHPEGPPFEHYGPLQSEQAEDHARAILGFVRSEMA